MNAKWFSSFDSASLQFKPSPVIAKRVLLEQKLSERQDETDAHPVKREKYRVRISGHQDPQM